MDVGRSTRQSEPGDRAVVAARCRQDVIRPAHLGDLEGAHDAPRVGEIDGRGPARRDRPESLHERLEADGEELRLEPGADGAVGGQRVGRECRGRRPAGTGPCRRPGSPRTAALGRRPSASAASAARAWAAKSATVKVCVRLDEVEAVMGDPAALGDRRLGRPDVEAAIHLARVGGDDLGRDPLPRQALRDVDRETGLAGGGGARDDEQRRNGRRGRDRGVGHVPTTVPRSAYGPACSIRAVTRRPTSSGPPARWTSLFWRLRPATREALPGEPSPAVARGAPVAWSARRRSVAVSRRGRGSGAG